MNQMAGSSSLPGKLMGLDVGLARIGVAVCDPLRLAARPLTVVKRRSRREDFGVLAEMVTVEEVEAIICGLPLNMDGSEGPRCQKTRAFARNLSRLTELPIGFWDERLSTVAAERALLEADTSRKRRGEVIDHVAAGFILQGVLDRLRNLRDAS